MNQCQEQLRIIYQHIGSCTILLTSVAVSIHGTGILVAALANPLQVFSTVSTVVIVLFYFTYFLADIFDCYEDMFNVSLLSNYRDKRRQVLFLVLRILTHVLVFAFFCLFSYTYLTAIIFIGGDNSGVISSIANVLPIILLTFFTWLSKHELQKFVKFESSNRSIDTTVNSSFDIITISSTDGSTDTTANSSLDIADIP